MCVILYLSDLESNIRFQDQESWSGCTGTGDSTAQVQFQPGGEHIRARRSRLACKGIWACLQVDPLLVDVRCYDLKTGTWDTVLSAQRRTSQTEGDSAIKRTVV